MPEAKGGFLFKTDRKIEWLRTGSFPVALQLRQGQKVILTRSIDHGDSITLDGIIKPGKYTVYLDVADQKNFWSAFGGSFVLNEDGKASIDPQPIQTKVKMRPLGPDKLESVSDKRPTLKWSPQEDATRYSVCWFEKDPVTNQVIKTRQDITTSETEYTFDEDVVPGRNYEWCVSAVDSSGKDFAYYSSCYFKTPK